MGDLKTYAKTLRQTPPVSCDFKVGDRIIFINESGIEFQQTIIGFADALDFKNRFIHADGVGAAYWFPHGLHEIRKAI